MRLGNVSLPVLASAVLCLGALISPAHAVPSQPWYLAAFDHVMRVLVNNEAPAVQMASGSAEQQNNVDPAYYSRVTKEAGTITLRGNVPSDGDLKVLQGVAAAIAPGASVVDRTRINPGVPNRDVWLAAMTFALRQMGKLNTGSASLRNAAITIEGVTNADDDFAVIQKKVREEAPKGLNLQVALKPHDVRPFVWLAQLQQGAVHLSGHVPSEQDKVIFGHAQVLFQNLTINSSMEVAKGEPKGWIEATKVSLEMLSLLYSGSVAISDKVVKIDGIYSSPAMVDLLKVYSKRLPEGFTLETSILEPVARAPAARAEDMSFAAHQARASYNP
ncbi:transport-associated protein [Rhodomicrobium vannielii ATCC 17100]|jgi:hypothetical protein|uniref:Transport-associated protein n=2 Tax=Rhodomicrobium vannielii TaxID=1069 RepID=E3I7E1_RHOVT|nr:transport-associated protein [Rhodomicrobium vannielii ATCC 17100]